MGIKLDWDIEAEQQQVRNTGEDPESARQRRRARLRLLGAIVFVFVLLGALAGAVVLRLRDVDQRVEQVLRGTVDAEITALRIADINAFREFQRSSSEDWLQRQEALFDQVQALKTERDVTLTGRILDLVIDDQRARVRVEEIIDGVPYGRVWFYWNYAEGWRHVPPDYTFWGEVETVSAPGVMVRYRTVDAALASAMASTLSQWVSVGCAALGCNSLPEIVVEIVPDEGLLAGWSPANPWALQVPSPAVHLARLDAPFEPALQRQVASLIAERLIAQTTDNLQPAYASDASFLRADVAAWLEDRFTQTLTEAVLIASLAQNYGEAAIGQVLQGMQPTSDISILNQAGGTASVDQLNLDWRGFLTWRLMLEQELNARRDQTNFLNLYDTGDESARNIAQSRFNALLPAETYQVTAVMPEIDANGVPHLRARVQIGADANAREEETIFRLVNGVWRRVN